MSGFVLLTALDNCMHQFFNFFEIIPASCTTKLQQQSRFVRNTVMAGLFERCGRQSVFKAHDCHTTGLSSTPESRLWFKQQKHFKVSERWWFWLKAINTLCLKSDHHLSQMWTKKL